MRLRRSLQWWWWWWRHRYSHSLQLGCSRRSKCARSLRAIASVLPLSGRDYSRSDRRESPGTNRQSRPQSNCHSSGRSVSSLSNDSLRPDLYGKRVADQNHLRINIHRLITEKEARCSRAQRQDVATRGWRPTAEQQTSFTVLNSIGSELWKPKSASRREETGLTSKNLKMKQKRLFAMMYRFIDCHGLNHMARSEQRSPDGIS